MNRTICEIDNHFRPRALSASLAFCLSIAPGATVAASLSQNVAAAVGSDLAVEATVDAGRLTLQTEGAPLAEVLRVVGEAGSFRVVLRGKLAEPIHRTFTNEPLEDAIRRLVEGHSVVILHADPDPVSGAGKLAEIRVIENPAPAASEAADAEPNAADPQVSFSEPEVAPEEEATDPVAREEAYRQAVFGYVPPAKEDLLFELDEPDPAVRVAAVPKVGSLRPSEAIEVIADVFASDEDTTVRSRAVAALSRLQGPWRARSAARASAGG
jgi:hypothetical protein